MILTFQGNREKNPNRSLFSVEVDFDDKRGPIFVLFENLRQSFNPFPGTFITRLPTIVIYASIAK